MSYDPIGRLLKITSLDSQKEKLNHVVMTKINPPQTTGIKMKAILHSNPPGSIPNPSRGRSVTIDVIGKPKTVFKEDNIDLSRQKHSVERHLTKPFGFTERVLSKQRINTNNDSQNNNNNNTNNKNNNNTIKQNQTVYQHPDGWNKSINSESKRKQMNQTKEEMFKTFQTMTKTQRDEFIFKTHNQGRIIQEFYSRIRKCNKKRYFIKQYGEDIDKNIIQKNNNNNFDDYDSELLQLLFHAYTQMRNIQITTRTDQKFIYLEELKDFCFTIGFNSKEYNHHNNNMNENDQDNNEDNENNNNDNENNNNNDEYLIEQFYDQIYNPELLQDAKIISSKPTLQSLRTLNIIEQLIPGQALVRKQDMISMRAVLYNYKKYLKEYYDIHEKFSKNAAKQLLVDLLANIHNWVEKKEIVEQVIKNSTELENEFLTYENLFENENLFKQINKKIKERNEQINEKLILSKFLYPIIKNKFLQIDVLKEEFIKQITRKAEKISLLESFINGFHHYLAIQEQNHLQNNSSQQQLQNNNSNSDSHHDGYSENNNSNEIVENKKLNIADIASFIQQNGYRGEQFEIITLFLNRILKQYNQSQNNNNNNNEQQQQQKQQYIMTYNVTQYCVEYKQKQDYKQNIIRQFIEKVKRFYDKHLKDIEINEINKKKYDSNTVGTYALKKLIKYDKIIGNRLYKINHILNIIQQKILFGYHSKYYHGPQNDNELILYIQSIINLDKVNFKIQELFNNDGSSFIHYYIKDLQEIQEKEKNKIQSWDHEIQQALNLYQRESNRLLNVVQYWKPNSKEQQQQQLQLQQKQQQQQSQIKLKQQQQIQQLQQQVNKAGQKNRLFLENFIENEEREYEEQKSIKKDGSQSQLSSNRSYQKQNNINNNQKVISDNNKSQKETKQQQQQSQSQIKNNNKSTQQINSNIQNIQGIRNIQNVQNNNNNNNKVQDQKKQNILDQQRQMNTQENENNLSFFEYIDNQCINQYDQDKNSSFNSHQQQQQSQQQNNNQTKTSKLSNNNNIRQKEQNNNIQIQPIKSNKQEKNGSIQSDNSISHQELSILNKTNQDSLDTDPSIKKTNQMYHDLYNILNSIKDEFDII